MWVFIGTGVFQQIIDVRSAWLYASKNVLLAEKLLMDMKTSQGMTRST
jgi:hypothetical protein